METRVSGTIARNIPTGTDRRRAGSKRKNSRTRTDRGTINARFGYSKKSIGYLQLDKAEQRELVKTLHEEHKIPFELECEVAGLPRSTYYYTTRRNEEKQLEADLRMECGRHPTYGTRRITHQLRRSPYEYDINRNHTQQIMRHMGLLRPVRRRKYRTTNSTRYQNLVENLFVREPEQVWVSDITYIRLGQGFVFLAVIMDVYTRAIRGWALSRSLDGELTLSALKKALEHRCPQIHHSDQRVLYAVSRYVQMLRDHNVQISMASVGKAEENGYAERLTRTNKEVEVDLSEYRDHMYAYQQMERFIEDVYLTKRIHSLLG